MRRPLNRWQYELTHHSNLCPLPRALAPTYFRALIRIDSSISNGNGDRIRNAHYNCIGVIVMVIRIEIAIVTERVMIMVLVTQIATVEVIAPMTVIVIEKRE